MSSLKDNQAEQGLSTDEIKQQKLLKCFAAHKEFTKIFLDSYVLLGHDGKILSFNGAFCTNFNFKPADIRKSCYFDNIFATSIEHTTESPLKQILASTKPLRIDEVNADLLIGSESPRTLIISSFPYLDQEHGFLGACIVIRDVTAESQLQGRYKEKSKESITDPLTGLSTRRHFEAIIERETEIIRREKKKPTLGILLFDLDKFKSINDQYGHNAGDFVLTEVAKVLRSVARQSDTLVRYGGEEMLALLINATPQGLCIAAEKFRKAIENHGFVFQGQQITVTTSVGVTMFLAGDANKLSTIHRADECLYAAKKSGRNVCFANFGEGSYRIPLDIVEEDENNPIIEKAG